MNLMTVLTTARWLTTSQVHRRFFPNASLDAARKRLRKLAGAKYLVRFRENRMSEAFFALGKEGRRVLEQRGSDVLLERRPPKQIEHFIGINDLRIAAELAGSLKFFFACWELSRVGWRHPVIPDAVLAIRAATFAAEFDRGMETKPFFLKTKVAAYRGGLEGLPITAVLIIADREARMRSLAQAIPNERGLFLFTTIALVREQGILAPIFRRHATDNPLTMDSLVGLSSREEKFVPGSGTKQEVCGGA